MILPPTEIDIGEGRTLQAFNSGDNLAYNTLFVFPYLPLLGEERVAMYAATLSPMEKLSQNGVVAQPDQYFHALAPVGGDAKPGTELEDVVRKGMTWVLEAEVDKTLDARTLVTTHWMPQGDIKHILQLYFRAYTHALVNQNASELALTRQDLNQSIPFFYDPSTEAGRRRLETDGTMTAYHSAPEEIMQQFVSATHPEQIPLKIPLVGPPTIGRG